MLPRLPNEGKDINGKHISGVILLQLFIIINENGKRFCKVGCKNLTSFSVWQ